MLPLANYNLCPLFYTLSSELYLIMSFSDNLQIFSVKSFLKGRWQKIKVWCTISTDHTLEIMMQLASHMLLRSAMLARMCKHSRKDGKLVELSVMEEFNFLLHAYYFIQCRDTCIRLRYANMCYCELAVISPCHFNFICSVPVESSHLQKNPTENIELSQTLSFKDLWETVSVSFKTWPLKEERNGGGTSNLVITNMGVQQKMNPSWIPFFIEQSEIMISTGNQFLQNSPLLYLIMSFTCRFE